MEYLKESHSNLLKTSTSIVRRELFDQIDWSHNLICIKGFRGVGKTSFLIDYLREKCPNPKNGLYINLNHFYFTGRKLFAFADEFYKKGGKTLVLDQIHKYPNWLEELHECNVNIPELKIIFAASPVLRVTEGNDLLKDKAKIYHLNGLSFREYLNYKTKNSFEKYSFEILLSNHQKIAAEITNKVKPLAYFDEYLKSGYYPYFLDRGSYYNDDLLKHINLALEIDVTYLNQIELKYLPRLRKLLYIIAQESPLNPNVSKLSNAIGTSRATVMNYLRYLKNAKLINMLYANGDEDQMKKPSIIYMQNCNLQHTVAPDNINNTTLRQTYFCNQVSYLRKLSFLGDNHFMVDQQHEFVVGGKYIEPENENGYAASDRIEVGSNNIIPLWLFGFLY